MRVGLVVPAFGRYTVSTVCFAAYAWLRDVLAERGTTTHVVVVADDANLDLAQEHGHDTLEAPNVLGLKINQGMNRVLEQGADWVCFTGSDNWLHPDLFDLCQETGAAVLAGQGAVIVDLDRGRAMTIRTGINIGHPPWLIPAPAWQPIDPAATRGIEWEIHQRRDHRINWNPPCPQQPAWRVGLKSSMCMTPYRSLTAYRSGAETSAADALKDFYPAELIDLAIDYSEVTV